MEHKQIKHYEVRDESEQLYDKIIDELNVISSNEDIVTDKNNYLFDPITFEQCVPLILMEQLAAINNEKIPASQFAKRFNRWVDFCDTVINMGISCLYSKEAIGKEDYETIFKSLKVNASFKEKFLKPHGLNIIFTPPNPEAEKDYSWLSLPYLEVIDKTGNKHLIMMYTSNASRVWWFDLLTELHSRANWSWVVPTKTDQSTVEDPVGFLEDVDAATIEQVSLALPVPSPTVAEVTEEEEEYFKVITDKQNTEKQNSVVDEDVELERFKADLRKNHFYVKCVITLAVVALILITVKEMV